MWALLKWLSSLFYIISEFCLGVRTCFYASAPVLTWEREVCGCSFCLFKQLFRQHLNAHCKVHLQLALPTWTLLHCPSLSGTSWYLLQLWSTSFVSAYIQETCVTAGILCQILSWWIKNWPHSINISAIVTNVVPLHSVYQVPSYEPSPTLLAPHSLLIWICYLFLRWPALCELLQNLG